MGYEISKSIKINNTAKQWRLFTYMGSASDAAAHFLNKEISLILNDSKNSYETAMNACVRIMQSVSQYGSTDSEPMEVLNDILEDFYDLK